MKDVYAPTPPAGMLILGILKKVRPKAEGQKNILVLEVTRAEHGMINQYTWRDSNVVACVEGHASHSADEGWGFLAEIVGFPETEA